MNIERSFAKEEPSASAVQASPWRSGVHRGRRIRLFIAGLDDVFNVLEAGCFLMAAATGAVVTAMAFGVHIA